MVDDILKGRITVNRADLKAQMQNIEHYASTNCVEGIKLFLALYNPEVIPQRAIFLAATEGHNEALLALSKGPANFNARDYNGNTPAHIVISEQNTKTLRLLLQLGADPSIANYNDHNLVQIAAIFGSVPALRMLAKHSPHLMIQGNSSCRTHLHFAAQYGNVEAVRFLIRNKGTNLTAKDYLFCTPRELAEHELRNYSERAPETLRDKDRAMMANLKKTISILERAEKRKPTQSQKRTKEKIWAKLQTPHSISVNFNTLVKVIGETEATKLLGQWNAQSKKPRVKGAATTPPLKALTHG